MKHTDDAEFQRPAGLALAILLTTAILCALTTVVTALRLYIRLRTRRLGSDDYLMLVGWFLNMAQSAVVMYGSLVGVGVEDHRLKASMEIEGMKYVFLWQVFYASALVFIKSSICCALKRITDKKNYILVLNILIALSVLMSGVGLIVILTQCTPIQGFWDSTRGTCWDPIAPAVMSYAASVANVITDFTVAIMPIMLLRDVQMKPRLKLYARLVLGLGILASIASIVRIPYTNAYLQQENFLYNVGNVILWTIVECCVGIIAGSLPSLRQFFKSLANGPAATPRDPSSGTELVTIGKVKGKHHPVYDSVLIATIAGENNEDPESDDASTKRIIRVTRELRQTAERQVSHRDIPQDIQSKDG